MCNCSRWSLLIKATADTRGTPSALFHALLGSHSFDNTARVSPDMFRNITPTVLQIRIPDQVSDVSQNDVMHYESKILQLSTLWTSLLTRYACGEGTYSQTQVHSSLKPSQNSLAR